MARAGLDADVVVRAAAELADDEGLEKLTLAALAARLGVRAPSLYGHVDGLADLRARLAIHGCAELREALAVAAAGRAGVDALRAIADAYRAFARAHPGAYAATRFSFGEDPRAVAAAAGVAEIVLAVMRGYGLHDDDAVHATRAVRAALHGFIALQDEGGFQMKAAPEESWQRMVALLDRGLASR